MPSEAQTAALPRIRRRRIRPPSKWGVYIAGWVVYGVAVLSKAVWRLASGTGDLPIVIIAILAVPGLVLWHWQWNQHRAGLLPGEPTKMQWILSVPMWVWAIAWLVI